MKFRVGARRYSPSPYIQVNLYTYVSLEMSLGAMINFIVADENGRGLGCKHLP